MATLTVLFTDLVDSTGLRVRLGEELADKVRVVHDRLVVSAIETNNGRVVKHTGDGFLATFEGASDGIGAAIAIQQAIDTHSRRDVNDALRVRIGLSVGDVTLAEDDDCFGLPVVEAQRLESAAEPGQILCSSLVRVLARGRGGHEFHSVGPLELKGLAEPLDADEVRWDALDDTSGGHDTLPPVLTNLGGFGFAGREEERATIAREWERAVAGETRVVLLAGEPGVGKTRLVAEAVGDLMARGATVIGGRCDELIGAPYQPFAEALRAQLRAHGAATELGPLAGELARLVPDVTEVVPGLRPPLDADPEAERVKLFDGVREWLAASAGEGLVLVLDDLHWADLGTLLLFRHVVQHDAVPRVLVVGTYRDTDLDRTHPLSSMLADFRRSFDVTRLAIGGLDESGVIDLVTGAAGHALDADGLTLARSLHAETDGNAFFVSEVLRHLGESGVVKREDGMWVAGREAGEFALPEGVREVVGRRLSMLPATTQETLAVASVVGASFTLDVLAAVSGEDGDLIVEFLEPARRGNLVVETGIGTYRFAHALVRSTLHHELSSTRRSRLHRRVATTLEARVADDAMTVTDAAELAYHWSEANAAGAPEEALVYSRRAAELAWAAAAPAEAARWYRHALELLDGEGSALLTCELTLALGEAELFAEIERNKETLRSAARMAEDIGNVDLMARALTLSMRSSFDRGQPADLEKIELLERALAKADDADPSIRAAVLAALAIEMIYIKDSDRQIEYYQSALAAAERVDDPDDRFLLESRANRARPWSLYTSAAAAEHVGDADLEAAWGSKSILNRIESASRTFWSGGMLGDRALMDRGTERHRQLIETGHPICASAMAMVELELALIAGRLDDAEIAGEHVRNRWSGRSTAEAETWYASMQYQVIRERGQLSFLTDYVVLRANETDTDRVPGILSALAGIALAESDRPDEAFAIVEERGVNGFRDIPDDAALLIARAAWAHTAALVGHRPAAGVLFDMLAQDPAQHLLTGGWYLGSSAYYLGLLAATLDRNEEASAWYEQALRDHETLDTPPWIARTCIDWAAHEHTLGHDEHARELAQQALDAIGDLQLEASRTRATALLQSLG